MPDRPLKILQFTTNFKQGGIQRHILDLTDHLRGKGHHVTLAGAANVWGNPDIDPDFEEVRLDLVSGTGTSGLGRLKAAWKTSQLLRRILQERDIDIVHSHETAPALVAKIALRTSKLPKVITYHGSAPARTDEGFGPRH